jgi:hypothetical protein
MQSTCGHCDNGLIGQILCPHCWGTTVSVKALTQAKVTLEGIREAYKAKKAACKDVQGRDRGMAGHELSQLGHAGRALQTEIEAVEQKAATNKTMLRLLAAAMA